MLKCFYLIVFFFLGVLPSHAEASDSLIVHSLAEIDSVPVIEQSSFFVDETNQLNWKDAMQQPFARRTALDAYIDSVYGKRRITLWLHLTVRNAMTDSLKLMMLFH